MKNSPFRITHPASMYLMLTMLVMLLSWIFEIYSIETCHPESGEMIRVQNLLSPEGIRWMLRHTVDNFTRAIPLGSMIVALFGLGIAQHAGFLDACLRSRACRWLQKRHWVLWSVITAGLLSNVLGDAGYVLLLPVAATLFARVGWPPAAGIIIGLVSTGCGYSANLMLTTLDANLAFITQEATYHAHRAIGRIGPLCNLLFTCASVPLLALIIHRISLHWLIPRLSQEASAPLQTIPSTRLSLKERRALYAALLAGLIYTASILWASQTLHGALRGAHGGLAYSPLMDHILLLLSTGIALLGGVYGVVSGRYRHDSELMEGMTCYLPLMRDLFITAFFAAQCIAFFEYSCLDQWLVIEGSKLLVAHTPEAIPALLIVVLLAALGNLFIPSSTAKWSLMAFLLLPTSIGLHLSPDTIQCAYRIGESSTNVLTPLLCYVPYLLALLRQYHPSATYSTLVNYTWRYSFSIWIGWSLFLLFWHLATLPLGI